MGRKTHTKDKDWTELEKYKVREKKFKREIARLRKMVQKLQEEHEMSGLLELVDVQRKEDKEIHDVEKGIELRKKWKCHECEEGIMILNIFNRKDGVFYFRRCYACGNKTRMKKYTNDVEGVKNEDLDKLNRKS